MLSPEDHEALEDIQNFFSPNQNYGSYRKKLGSCVPPLVPFMVIALTDLTFIDENENLVPRKSSSKSSSAATNSTSSSSTTTEAATNTATTTSSVVATVSSDEKLVNFLKMGLLAKVILNLRRWQKAPYKTIAPISQFQNLFAEPMLMEPEVDTKEEAHNSSSGSGSGGSGSSGSTISKKHHKKEGEILFDCMAYYSESDIYKCSLEVEPKVQFFLIPKI